MAVSRQTIALSKPLSGVKVAYYGPAEIPGDQREAIEEEGYTRGYSDASRVYEQQILEQRQEVAHLQAHLFESIQSQFQALVSNLDQRLPEVVIGAVRKLIRGLELKSEDVLALIDEVLGELAPQGEDMELLLAPEDVALLQSYDKALVEGKYPGVQLKEDSALSSGDVMIRSRFGIVDARMKTKLRKVEKEIRGSH